MIAYSAATQAWIAAAYIWNLATPYIVVFYDIVGPDIVLENYDIIVLKANWTIL